MHPNPFSDAIRKLLDRLADLTHVTYSLEIWLGKAKNGISKDPFQERIFVNTNFFITNPMDAHAKSVCWDSTLSKGNENTVRIDNLISASNAWSFVQSFEAFETFLYDLLASNYLLKPLPKCDKNVTRFIEKKSASYEPASPIFWRKYAKFCFQTNEKGISEFKRISLFIKQSHEIKDRYGKDYTFWFKALELARHSITHSASSIPRSRVEALPQESQKWLFQFFGTKFKDDDLALCAKDGLVMNLSSQLACYGFVFYKGLSDTHGMALEIEGL